MVIWSTVGSSSRRSLRKAAGHGQESLSKGSMSKSSFIGMLLGFALAAAAQNAPKFAVDPSWPKPLPAGWIVGQLGGVCVDSHDHIVVVNRRNITEEEKETSQQAPPILMFDTAGNLVKSFGDPDKVPSSIHGCTFDGENNVWVGGNTDGIIQKYDHDGKMLMQIGTRGLVDSTDGTQKGKPLNAAHDRLYNPSGIVVDPANGDFTYPTATATGASWCSTRPANSCASGAAKGPRRRPKTASPACSHTTCIAST